MDKTSSAKVGFVTLVGLILLVSLLVWKSGIISRVQGFELVGRFENINGLLEGAEVRYRGFRIGSVLSVDPQPESIMVRIKVNRDLHLPHDSFLRIEFDGLIGEKYIGIVPGKNTAEFYQPGQVMPGNSSAGIVDFIDIGTQNLKETKKILSLVYEMLEDGEIQSSIKNILNNVEITTKEVNELVPLLQVVAQNLNDLTLSVTPILTDQNLHSDLQNTMANLNQASSELNSLIDNIDQETRPQIEKLLGSVTETSDDLRSLLEAFISEE